MYRSKQIQECYDLGNELFKLGSEQRKKEIDSLNDGAEKDKLLKEQAKSKKNQALFNTALSQLEFIETNPDAIKDYLKRLENEQNDR